MPSWSPTCMYFSLLLAIPHKLKRPLRGRERRGRERGRRKKMRKGEEEAKEQKIRKRKRGRRLILRTRVKIRSGRI